MFDELLVQRFHEKFEVDPISGCWLWTASTAGKGYGQIKVPGTRRQVYAHRLSYEIYVGPIPDGMMVLHRCDNPPCVNPEHLFLGTGAVNLMDMAQKGRHLYGERNTEHKLTEIGVHRIFDLAEAGWSQRRIANEMEVGQAHVGRILRGLRWRHVFLQRSGV